MTLSMLAGLAAVAFAQNSKPLIPAWNRASALNEDQGSPVERGTAVFNNWCSACHSRDVRNGPGTRSLQNKYQGKLPAALEDRTDLSVASVELFVRRGVATMPFYRKTEVSDADLAALAAYLTRKRE